MRGLALTLNIYYIKSIDLVLSELRIGRACIMVNLTKSECYLILIKLPSIVSLYAKS